jgi:site-specific recombinase XerD
VAQVLPKTLFVDEIGTFITSLRTLRDRALFELVVCSGLRTSEALHLKIADIDWACCAVCVGASEGCSPITAASGRSV